MAAARYWRLVGIESYGGAGLELSELQLYGDSGRIDAGATLTCSHVPISGALGGLLDADLTTVCRIAAAAVRSPGFTLVWDLGVGVTAEVIGLRVGSSPSRDMFLSSATLQYHDGAAWIVAANLGRFPWPGPSTLGPAPKKGSLNQPSATLFLDGFVDISDTSPVARPMTSVGGVSISDDHSLYGGKSMLFDGSTGYLTSPPSSSLAIAEGEDFTISFNAWKNGNGQAGYDGVLATTTDGSSTNGLVVELSSTRGFMLGSKGIAVFILPLNPNTAQWLNWEISRKSGTLRVFRHGVKIHEMADARAYPQAGLAVGNGFPGGPYFFKGHLQQVMMLKGVALHEADFAPASLVEAMAFDALPVLTRQSAILVSASSATAAHSTIASAAATACDVEVGGPGTIYGTTKTKGTPNQPTHARVVLLHQRSKLPVRETWSDPVTGAFAFTGIDTTQQFLTLAEDAAGNFRPVAANRLTPEVLP